jgi:hypothetical protein
MHRLRFVNIHGSPEDKTEERGRIVRSHVMEGVRNQIDADLKEPSVAQALVQDPRSTVSCTSSAFMPVRRCSEDRGTDRPNSSPTVPNPRVSSFRGTNQEHAWEISVSPYGPYLTDGSISVEHITKYPRAMSLENLFQLVAKCKLSQPGSTDLRMYQSAKRLLQFSAI